MSFLSSLFLGAAALLSADSSAYAQGVSSVSIELRREALVERPRIALADIATVRMDGTATTSLNALQLDPAPRVGHVVRYSRPQLEQAIRRFLPDAGHVAWLGAESVTVRTRAQSVTAQSLSDAALHAGRAHFNSPGQELTVALAAPLSHVDVPTGSVEIRARPIHAKVQGGRVPLWLDLLVDGTVYRSVVAQLLVAASQPAYVARRDLAVGERASDNDFAITTAEVAGIRPLRTDKPLGAFRVGHPIRSGEALQASFMLDSGKILRGDQVRVQVAHGQIGIETAAIAMVDAAPGQLVRVRPSGSQDIVTGRVSRSGLVILE